MKLAFKNKLKRLLTHIKLYVTKRPKLKKVALVILAKFPNLRVRLEQTKLFNSSEPITDYVPNELARLTPRGRQIHKELKASIEHHQKDYR